MVRHLLKILFLSASITAVTPVWCYDLGTVPAKQEAPPGVVFEIVSDEYGLLDTLLPSIKQDIRKLRERFPDLPIAIVTHGSEQFGLMNENRDSELKAHNLVEELVDKDDVEVYVCGTHAEWYGKTPEDFPDYVNVSSAGPAQINDYEAMGYDVIVLP
jgi:intracellular sulfur oxidation DsrE/DsrF family protein